MNESYDFKGEIYEREYGKRKGQEFVILTDIEETRYKELIAHNDVIFAPVMGKYMEKNLDITNLVMTTKFCNFLGPPLQK